MWISEECRWGKWLSMEGLRGAKVRNVSGELLIREVWTNRI